MNSKSDVRATFLQHENRFQMGDSGPTLLALGEKVPTTHNLERGGRGRESLGGDGGRVVLEVVIADWEC